MSKLKRPYQMKFYVSENERKLIYKRMHSIGFQRLGAFARKMLLNGVVVNPVIPNLDKVTIQLSRIGNNINQATRRINASVNPSQRDVDILKKEMHEIWLLLKSIESTLR